MRGPLFKKLLQRRGRVSRKGGRVRVGAARYPRESISDLETMYSLIIRARGKTETTMTEFDEELALAALCQWSWPGKVPSYRFAVRRFIRVFRGIADSPNLQIEFRKSIGNALANAQTPDDISFNNIAAIFSVPQIILNELLTRNQEC
jgi:hypothetical protein